MYLFKVEAAAKDLHKFHVANTCPNIFSSKYMYITYLNIIYYY